MYGPFTLCVSPPLSVSLSASNYFPFTYGLINEQTDFFNHGMATSLGEERLLIQTS